ncbi:MAG TPA: DnaA/Hda family protein [Candidatus Thalassarchaeaceae archaeon]|nr:DnaA/Hda family protein [Candidatus Thalassarchaeaceae archaeon]
MSIIRTPLRDAMERSRRFLGESERKAPSPEGKSTLLDNVSIRERARAEARFAARHELPSNAPSPLERLSILSGDGTDYAETVHARLEAMRGRILEGSPLDLDSRPSNLPAGTPRWVSGQDGPDSRDPIIPIWREVLDQHRGLNPAESLGEVELGSPQISDPGPAPSSVEFAGYWPPYLTERSGLDFSTWQQGPSNRIATQAASEVIDYPGRRLNPLLIHGTSGTGKSHLLWAIGESLHSGIPDRDVRLITAETFPEHLPDGWDDLLLYASSLLIDDADRILMRPTGAANLANVVGWAIDIGAQVILTSSRRLAADSLPIGRLRQAITSGVHVELGTPSESTMLMMLRRNTLSRNASLTDPQLQVIVSRSRGQWSRVKADFETVCLALDSGASLMGAVDIRTLLSGEAPTMSDEIVDEPMDADAMGAQIVAEVLDAVLPEPAEHRAEIISERLDVTDDYVPPEITLPSSLEAAESLTADTLRSHLEEISARGSKSTSAPQIPVGQNIDALAESALGHLESIIHEHRFELRELNREIQHISRRVGSASPDELVSFTDRMLAIEGHLDKLQELSAGEYAPSLDDFDPGELIQATERPVLIPDYSEPAMAILWPLKRRVLLPVE